MASELSLFNDISNNRLVTGLNNQTAVVLRKFFQGELIKLRVTPVKPTDSAVAPFYKKVSLSNLNLRLSVGPRAGPTSLLAFQDSWSKQTSADDDGESGYFFANLDLNTTELNNKMGGNQQISTYFEFQVQESSNWRVSYQNQIDLVAIVRDPSGAADLPSPSDSFPTWEQAEQAFLRRQNDAGVQLVLTSPSGTYQRIFGVDDNGAPLDLVAPV